MAQMPKSNLPPDALEWGRQMQERLDAADQRNADLAAQVASLGKSLNSALLALSGVINFNPDTIEIDMSQVPTGDLDQSRVTGTWDKAVSTSSTVAGNGGVSSSGIGTFVTGVNSTGVYAQSVAGMGGFRTVSVAANGVMGGLTSSARYKEGIADPEIPIETLRALRAKFYRYIAQTDAREPLQMSFIAEDVHDLGLRWLVAYDEEGRPDGLNERAVPYLVLLLAQSAHDRIDALEGMIANKE